MSVRSASALAFLALVCPACAGNDGPASVEEALVVPPRTPLDLIFRYTDFSGGAALSLVGDAALAPRAGGPATFLRVTESAYGVTGAAWYPERVPVAGGFVARFRVRFRAQGTSGGTAPGADGLAFVIQNAGPAAIGLGGCQMGYGGVRPSLAVELDTFDNSFYCDLADPNDNHVSVHVNGDPDERRALGSTGTSLGVNLKDGQPHDVTVSYFDRRLSVYVDDETAPKLAIDGVDVAAVVGSRDGKAWVGFTGATAVSFETHEVHRWSFSAVRTLSCGTDVVVPSGEELSADVDLGATSGTTILTWTQPHFARFIVNHQGAKVFDSGCTQVGRGTVPVHYDGTSSQLELVARSCGRPDAGPMTVRLDCLRQDGPYRNGADTDSFQTELQGVDVVAGFYIGEVGQPGELHDPCHLTLTSGSGCTDMVTLEPCQRACPNFAGDTARSVGPAATYAYWFLRGSKDVRDVGQPAQIDDDMRSDARRYGRVQAEALIAQAQRNGSVIGGRTLFVDIEDSPLHPPRVAGWYTCEPPVTTQRCPWIELNEIVLTEVLERIVGAGFVPGVYTSYAMWTAFYPADFVPAYQHHGLAGKPIPFVLWVAPCGQGCAANVFTVGDAAARAPQALDELLGGAKAVVWQYYVAGDPDAKKCPGDVRYSVELDITPQDPALGFVPDLPSQAPASRQCTADAH